MRLVESALKEHGKWRLTISPSLEVSEGQDFNYIGTMLTWAGDRLYHHTALRKGCEVGQEVFGALHEGFRFNPVSQGLMAPRRRLTVFYDKLQRETVESLARRHGLRRSSDQENALRYVQMYPSPLLAIRVLAGTGKSTVAGVSMEAYMQGMPHGEVVVI